MADKASSLKHENKIPTHCPGCGTPFPGVVSVVCGYQIGRLVKPSSRGTSMVDRQPYTDERPLACWDCWCPTCDWSGDVSSDH